VVTNLVSNAIKYTPEGGQIDLELADTEDGIRISVFDTGPGIDEDLAGRLFGRFERTAGEGRRKQGTGLGLNLSKQLIEEHGGTISVRRRDTVGAELRVQLPASLRLDDSAAPSVKRSIVPDPTHVSDLIPLVPTASRRLECHGISKGTVLLAEDDVRLAAAVGELLRDDYTVLVAHDGATALKLAREHKPQVLVTDVEMPGLSGIELAREFRTLMDDVFAPVIILSAVMDLRTRVEGLDAGAVDYVTKPFDPLELKARVRSQFRMREISLRLHRAEQLATLGFLTTGLAHELRNPANGIVNAIEPLLMLLPEDLKEPEHPVAQLVGAVSECAEQIRFLSRQLLGFRRSDATIAMGEHPLRGIIDRAINLSSGAFKQVEARIDIDASVLVRCSPPLLTQVFTNLLENAAHAAGRSGWVAVRLDQAGGRMTVQVTDSGPGVPVELRTRVFEPFFTTKPAGVGNGLGLPLSRDIVMRHGGVLEIRGDGTDTAFVVELPDAHASAQHANAI
jgi:signal transduction histidine kinase